MIERGGGGGIKITNQQAKKINALKPYFQA